jgi:hypothetical protein
VKSIGFGRGIDGVGGESGCAAGFTEAGFTDAGSVARAGPGAFDPIPDISGIFGIGGVGVGGGEEFDGEVFDG